MSLSKRTITFSMIILLILIIFGYLLYQEVNKFPKGSKVATILVENYSEEEAKKILEEEVNKWKANHYIDATSESDVVHIPREIFIFNIDATLEKLNTRTKSWFPLFKKSNIEQSFVIEVNENSEVLKNIPSIIDVDSTLAKAKLLASNLSENPVELVYSSQSTKRNSSVATESFMIPSGFSKLIIDNMIKQLNSITFAPNSTFSFTEVFPEIKEGEEDELNLLASQVYSLILLSNFIVLERYSQGTIPVYTDPGIEVAINPKNEKDLLIFNPNDYTYQIKFERKGNELVGSLQTVNDVKPITYNTRIVHEVEPRTVYRYSKDLTAGQQEIIQEGISGMEVEVYRTVQGEEQLISKDFYPPKPRVVSVPISSGMITGQASNFDSQNREQFNSEIDLTNEQPESSRNGDGNGNSEQLDDDELHLSKTFYDFVLDYCENLERNGLVPSDEGEESGSCPETLHSNQLQMLRLIWTFYSQDATEEQENEEEQEKEIFVK